MKPTEPRVLYEDNHLLVIDKPAPLATMGAAAGEPTAVEWARDYLKRRYDKPGNVFIGVVSRLDAFVTGVLPLARTSKGAARLSASFAGDDVAKHYVAWLDGMLPAAQGSWRDRLRHDDQAQRVVVERGAGGQEAELHWERIATIDDRDLVAIRLITGRKHQIRVQASSRRLPIVGDVKYGGPRWSAPGIALHAARIVLPHPTRREPMTFEAPLPETWPLAVRRALS